jgi:FkbM family methyltransferase
MEKIMYEKLPGSDDDLYYQVVKHCLESLKVNTFTDNYDAGRYGFDGVDRSMVFQSQYHAQQFKWFNENYKAIFKALNLFADDVSKRLYLWLIAYRLAGFHSIKIPIDFDEKSNSFDEYVRNEKYTESEIKLTGIFGGIRHYDFKYEGKHYLADCLGFKETLYRKQYFFNRNGIKIAPEQGDYVIDGGACLGDTAIVFGNQVGAKGCVYSFDPVWEHLKVLEYNASINPLLNIKIMPYGISDTDVDCEPLKVSTYSPGFNMNNKEVPLRSIDTLVIDGEIDRIDYIKLDVEGAELVSLKGASGSIRKFKPKLGISLYHKPNDIFELPLFIRENFPEYKIYLNHYTIHNEETVMYCVV